MLKRILLAMLFLLLSSSAQAQNNSIFLEGGGNGAVYSLNYERVIDGKIGLRGGWSRIELTDELDSSAKYNVQFIPVIGTLMWGGDHRLEIGGGVTFVRVDGTISIGGSNFTGSGSGNVQTGVAGYRYQKSDSRGLLFRASYTPIRISGSLVHWGGVSLGYSF
ncbi:MAG: hypothetical protein VYA69_05360 [Gemmatimonadota bacterium]|nr:hypothetical protein [Gemmatimonadota bacterium]